jgi:hypothetical protein
LTGELGRQVPVSSMCYISEEDYRIEQVSEIAAYPMGFVLYFDPDENTVLSCADIISFVDYDYDEVCNIEIALPVYECNIMFPLDYRSKTELMKK